jgi:hypothetical protein
MLGWMIDELEEWLRSILKGMIETNLETMFNDMNVRTADIATQVGKTPSGWNGSIYSFIYNISDTVILPIAGLIITFVLCYELISMLTERNNMHEMDTWMFFKYFFKMWVAVFLVSNTWNITMAIFDVGQYVVNSASGVISSSTAVDWAEQISIITGKLEGMDLGELVTLTLETAIVSLGMKILSVVITVIVYGRMIEIYLYTSVAPIPFATLTNKEWGQVGTGYMRGLFALAFQGLLMMVCVGIYAVLISTVTTSDDLHSALFGIMGYSVILIFSLFKTSSLAKSIFNAH